MRALGPVLPLGGRRPRLYRRRRRSASSTRSLASAILTLLLGAGLIAAGVVRAYLGFQLPADHPRAHGLLAAAVTILLGLIIVIHWPLDSVYVLGTLLGVDLLFHGAAG